MDTNQLNNLLDSFDLPSHRRDASRPTNLSWLVQNLHVRGKANPKFKEAYSALIGSAQAQKLMTLKELEQLKQKHLS